MFHTPKKSIADKTVTLPASNTSKSSSPQAPNVRSSIGEWEAGKPGNSRSNSTSPAEQAVAPKPPRPAPIRRLSGQLAASTPKPTSTDATSAVVEARQLQTKIKQTLATSRNTRKDIIESVLRDVGRLSDLVAVINCKKTEEPAELPPKRQQKSELVEERENQKMKELEKTIERHTELLIESNERIEGLKELLLKKSYASVAATSPRSSPPVPTALHSVVVTATDETETGEEILKRIRTAVNAKEGDIRIERVRKAKDRKVIMGCRTEEERRKVKEVLTRAPELKVEDIKNKDPLIMLRNVLQFHTDEEIIKGLKNQNKTIFRDLGEENCRTEIAFKKRTKNQHTHHIVMRVSAVLWRRMLEAGAVHIDLQRVKVEDQSPLVQCSLCLGYGHGRRFCTESNEKCSHCGGPHMRDQCSGWLAGVEPTCTNCLHAKLVKTDHNAFSLECPVRRKWDQIARSTIAYC